MINDKKSTFLSRLAAVIVALLLLALVVTSWLPRMHGPLDLRWDGAVYYVLGTALAESKGYRLLNEPGEIKAVLYPPLLPAIIAAHQLVLGTNDPIIVGRWLRLSFFLIFATYIFTSYLVVQKFLPRFYALVAIVVVGLNLYTIVVSNWCFAEIPFALATMLFVMFNSQEHGRLSQAFAALFATAAYFLRTAGIALLAAWVGEAFFKRQYRKACLRIAFSLIPVLTWFGYVLHVESSTSYVHPAYAYQRADYLFYNVSYSRNLSYRDPFRPELGKASLGDVIARFRNNLTRIPAAVGESVSAKQEHWPLLFDWILEPVKNLPGTWRILKFGPKTLVTLLGTLVLAGMVLQFIRGSLLIPLYVTALLLIVCLNPWPELFWARYMMPLAPFLALALVECLLTIRRYVSGVPLGQMRAVASILFLALIGLVVTVQTFTLRDLQVRFTEDAVSYDRQGRPIRYRLFWYDKRYRALDQGLDWLRARARPEDIIATAMPQWAYLRTGLKAVMSPSERDLGKMQEFLDSVPVAYVVVAQFGVDHTRDYTLPLLERAPNRWAHVYRAPDGGLDVYQRIRSQRSGPAPRN